MFAPFEAIAGAFLLHQATTSLLFYNGAILGASGLLRKLLDAPSMSVMLFHAGIASSLLITRFVVPEILPVYPALQGPFLGVLGTVIAGALTGWGTKNCNGCTSGHMLCGLARLSGRSVVATSVFFPTAFATYHLVNPRLSDECSLSNPCYLPVYPSTQNVVSITIITITAFLAVYKISAFVERATDSAKARLTTDFFCGYTFGLGLIISGMASPSKVLSFFAIDPFSLSPSYRWDPSMALLFFFGVGPNYLSIRARGFSKPPGYSEQFNLPTKNLRDVDWRFVVGAAAFGIAWGLTGSCPGPAILRSLSQPAWGALWLFGFWLGGKLAP